MKIFNPLSRAVAALTALCMVSVPIAASAQEAAGSRQYSVTYVAPTDTVKLVEPAKGLALPPEEASMLAKDGCLVGPLSTTQGLYDWAERKGVAPCSPDFYKKVDTYAGKESMVTYRVARMADGYQNCNSAKSVNLGNNRMSCVLYPFNPDFNLQGQVGKYADVNWAEGGDSVKARIFGGALGAVIAGPLTAATGQLLAPKCTGNSCGGPQVVTYNQNISGSTATSGLNAVIQGGAGTCATCTTPPSGHTQNGPGN